MLERLRRHPEPLGAVRRRVEQGADQVCARAWHRFWPAAQVPPFDGHPRLALVTVNFSTTRYLQLMLCTLGAQSHRSLLERIVIVDNGSRDGGLPFLRAIASRVPSITLVERRHWLNHAAGMRAGLRALDGSAANLVLFCDPDVVFRDPDTLGDLTTALVDGGAAFAGEARNPTAGANPDVQASFFLVRRDVLARRDVAPLADHGSPALRLQATILGARLRCVDFPSNHGGYVLHRGRTAVAAAGRYHPRHSYAHVASRHPHYMGVPDGAAIWAAVEAQWSARLEPTAEGALLDHLVAQFAAIGEPPPTGGGR